jgi:hypothetical protein
MLKQRSHLGRRRCRIDAVHEDEWWTRARDVAVHAAEDDSFAA